MGRHAGGITEHLRLSTAIRKAGRRGILRLIADIKPVSPRDGDLVGQRDVADMARSLVKAGACALSVVTEPRQFGGRLEILRRVSEAVPVPVLRKDFLTAPEQVEVSSAHGAAAILLILATTPDRPAADLYRSAQNRGLEVVVEIHTIEELQRALAPPFVTTTAVVGGPVEEMGPSSGWCALRGITDRISLPLILSGGLNAGNVRTAIKVLRPYAVDVISDVERRTGEKDPDLIREFVQAVKRF